MTDTQIGYNLGKRLSEHARFFTEPAQPRHRQYEALRAFFVESRSGKDIAHQFGYTVGAFHVLCHQFRKDPDRLFFVQSKPGPRYGAKPNPWRDKIITLRKQNYSIADIQCVLKAEGFNGSGVYIWTILKDEGFSKLPRRSDKERPNLAKAEQAPYADVRNLSFTPRVMETKIGGLYILLKFLAEMEVSEIAESLNWYGSKMIPTRNAFLSCILLKLVGKERKSHIMDLVFDDGAAFGIGLNAVPKTAYMSEYSERITHEDNIKFMHIWLTRLRKFGVANGESFNLDFQSLPYFGEDAVVEKHYVSMRSRRQKAVLVFFAQDAGSKIFCYSNADLRKGDESSEIFRFIEFWKKQSGNKPPHLVFDSKLTTYSNLSKLNEMKITFVTLRRRTPNVVAEVSSAPSSAWRKITLRNVARKFRTPKVIDRTIKLADYKGSLRQIFVKDLGHELPTILMTNDQKTSCSELISRYALRMLIENAIANGIGFFHNGALSSSVAMRIDFDILLTMVAQATYHLFTKTLRGYEQSDPAVIFRKFIDTPAKIIIGEKEVEVRLNKRANNPILIKSGLINSPFTLPWLKNMPVVITLK